MCRLYEICCNVQKYVEIWEFLDFFSRLSIGDSGDSNLYCIWPDTKLLTKKNIDRILEAVKFDACGQFKSYVHCYFNMPINDNGKKEQQQMRNNFIDLVDVNGEVCGR